MTLSFIVSHEAYYWPHVQAHMKEPYEISVQDRIEGDGVTWEFYLRWHELGDNKKPTLRLEMFEDAFNALNDHFVKVLMSELPKLGNDPQPAEVIELLKALRFEDKTQRESPNKHATACALCKGTGIARQE